MFERRKVWAAAVAVAGVIGVAEPAAADSLDDALASAYEDNPDLNAARAQLRGIDENVPQALAGYRPTVSASANAGLTRQRTFGSASGLFSSGITYSTLYPRSVSLVVNQPLFLGFRTEKM